MTRPVRTKSERRAARYLRSNTNLERAGRLAKALQDAVVLGLGDRELLYAIDRRFYAGKRQYFEDDYNSSGLWPWEQKVVDQYFSRCKRVLVTSTGGGREVLALRRVGVQAEGFECNAEMVRAANLLLERETGRPGVLEAPPDKWPDLDGVFDGIIIGWGSIMHVQGRDARIAFLTAARKRVPAGAPLLVSFFVLQPGHSYFRVVARVGSVLRSLRRQPALDLGDSLVPHYCHSFTRESIANELGEAGFDLVHFSEEDYGHAAALARDTGHPVERRRQ